MAVILLKEISREILSTTMFGENLIITLKPGDLLEFRIKGKRQRFEVPLAHCFNLAQILKSNDDFKEAEAKYNEKKKAGLKARKPKKVIPPFNKIYFKALDNK